MVINVTKLKHNCKHHSYEYKSPLLYSDECNIISHLMDLVPC